MSTLWVTLWISVFDVEDAQHAILTDREEMSVVVGDAEASDRGSMSLNLSSLLEGELPDLDRTWVRHVTLLTDTAEKNLARVMYHELRDVMGDIWPRRHWVRPIICLRPWNCIQIFGRRVDNFLATHSDELVILAWYVDDGGELHVT